MDLRELGDSLLQEPAEPFRFNFETAWEVADELYVHRLFVQYIHDDLKLHAWQHVHGLGAELRFTSESRYNCVLRVHFGGQQKNLGKIV